MNLSKFIEQVSNIQKSLITKISLECETKTKPKPRVGFDLSKNTSIANNVPDETRDSTAEAHTAGEDFSQEDTQPLDSDDDNIKAKTQQFNWRFWRFSWKSFISAFYYAG